MEDDALIEPAATGGYAVQRAGVEAGDIVVVHGTGAIGLFAVQYAKILGASVVILSGRKDFKLKFGETVGADILINTSKDDLKTIRLMEAGRIKSKPLITHRFPFAKIKEALKAMTTENKTRIKIMLEVK